MRVKNQVSTQNIGVEEVKYKTTHRMIYLCDIH